MDSEQPTSEDSGEALPTDQEVQALCFESGPQRAERRGPEDIHLCPDCSSGLVYPIEWAPADTKQWRVGLRCPECEWHGDGVFSQDVVDEFDLWLDRGTEAMLDDLHRLSRANMEDQVERFVRAIATDQILPEDF